MINGQFIKLGPRHAGKIVTVVIEDTHYRILHGEDELAVRPRKNLGPITRLYVKAMGTQKDRQGSPETSHRHRTRPHRSAPSASVSVVSALPPLLPLRSH
ncbi:hypothetical protein ACFWWC_48370 [Streptomyces sp. NPDC058642]|uniref:hypothetical protein n=1 Tax=Streptomyces sp. NPDC058642 TaxID=3346572 RepID=UPI00365AEC65